MAPASSYGTGGQEGRLLCVPLYIVVVALLIASLLLQNCIGSDLPSGTYDFGFLSSRAFLLTVTTGHGSLALYTFNGDGDSSLMTDQSKSISALVPSPPMQIAVLNLPTIQPKEDLHRFTTHSPPFVAHQWGRPFQTSRDSRLHVMTLHYGDRSGDFNMFVHNNYLLSFVSPGVRFEETVTPIVKDWDDWGPDHTRFMPFTAPFQWLRHAHTHLHSSTREILSGIQIHPRWTCHIPTRST